MGRQLRRPQGAKIVNSSVPSSTTHQINEIARSQVSRLTGLELTSTG